MYIRAPTRGISHRTATGLSSNRIAEIAKTEQKNAKSRY
jgi:hypothetical protein